MEAGEDSVATASRYVGQPGQGEAARCGPLAARMHHAPGAPQQPTAQCLRRG